MANGPIAERNRGKNLITHHFFIQIFCPFSDATIYVGGLDDKVSESLLWELFVQAGPLGRSCTALYFKISINFFPSECPHA